MTPQLIGYITTFVLAAFVGIEVISKVPTILHTPLMSGSNAIHGIILVFPCRAPLGELSCLRPRMNRTAAKRYRRLIPSDRVKEETAKIFIPTISPYLLWSDGRRALNISSMRSVTTNPPTTFIVARTIAAIPNQS